MFTNEYIEKFEKHDFDKRLEDIYGNCQLDIECQRLRYINALNSFVANYGPCDISIFSAPGRTEVCGNHTDHQNGKVLAASVNMDMIAVVSQTDSDTIHIVSEGYSPISININDLDIDEDLFGTTSALIKGMLYCFKSQDYRIGGFNAYITSNVPDGAGLSSSAAFETLIGTILSGLFNDSKVSSVDIAIWGQYAENKYFGKPCGLMDQTACSVGGFVFIDFSTTPPTIDKVDFDIEACGYSLCIVDTKGSHADLTDDYAAVPSEMKNVAAFFHKNLLGEIDKCEFIEALPELYKNVNSRSILRALHFFNENERVTHAVWALKNRNTEEFLSTIKASGSSSMNCLQNIYSNKEARNQPLSLALALTDNYIKDNGVCRVHGGGFAGTIQVFVKTSIVKDYKEYIEGIFGNGSCHIVKIRKYGGVRFSK